MADLYAMIASLYQERDRIDRAIVRLKVRKLALAQRNRRNAGRKSMPPEERAEVPRRMVAYWAEKRKRKREGTPALGENGSAV